MINLTIEADTPQKLQDYLSDILAGRPAARPAKESTVIDAAVVAETKTDAPKRTRKPAQTGGGMPDEKPEEVEQFETATFEQMKAALLQFVDMEDQSEEARRREEIPSKILAEFGEKKISEVKPKDYAKIIARAEEELKKEGKAK